MAVKDLTMEDVLEYIDNMKVLELAELIKKLEEKYGVSASAPVAVAAAGGGAAAAAVEEKTSFEVILSSYEEDKKIKVIKVVREITGLGLKEAKDLVEGAPKSIKSDVTKDEAEDLKKKVEEAGAKVTVK